MALVEGDPSQAAGNVTAQLAHVLRFEYQLRSSASQRRRGAATIPAAARPPPSTQRTNTSMPPVADRPMPPAAGLNQNHCAVKSNP